MTVNIVKPNVIRFASDNGEEWMELYDSHDLFGEFEKIIKADMQEAERKYGNPKTKGS